METRLAMPALQEIFATCWFCIKVNFIQLIHHVILSSEYVFDVYMYIRYSQIVISHDFFLSFNLLIYNCTDILFLLVDVNWL